jgi:hypothetical protein
MRTSKALCLLTLLAAAAFGQGPDVIVGSLNGIGNYGHVGNTYAYSVGTTSCNIGNFWLNWFQGTNQHPVIGQSFYRIKNGRFEQIGYSWLKHGFFALSQNLCFSDCQGTTGEHLGVHCSDPYDTTLNGDQSNGPRSEVNAATGYFPFPYLLSPPVPSLLERRIQCQLADIDPAQNAGAVYLAEGQYVTPDDAAAGNKNNNASSRLMTFTAAPTCSASLSGGTFQQVPAIMRWPVVDPTVVASNVDIPNDGRFIVAKKITSLGGGNYHYEIAVHNLNSDRSGRGFTVDFPAGTVITNAGNSFVPCHSGEVWSNAAWTTTIGANSVNWVTQTAQQNINASAIRFGNTHSFWFDATAAAENGTTIELFKPEPCPADPVVPTATVYTLNTGAAFDNPTITGSNGPQGDDNQLTVPIGFTFTFFGQSYTNVSICTNGYLEFNGSSAEYTNVCIPSATAPNGFIAGYWDDLIAPVATSIKYQTIGSAPNRRFVVSYSGMQLYANTSSLQSFKIILDETTNVITTSIISSAAGGSSATRGIEDPLGNTGVQASCGTGGSAIANTSQTYTPSLGVILPSATLAVTGSTGANGVLTWTINSVARSAPVVLVASLDPGPLNLGPLGIINLGLTPGLYAVIADGAGALQGANPAHATDWYCGDFQISVPLGPGGLPPGLTIYNQGVILAPPTSNPPPPNGQFHITTPVTINT